MENKAILSVVASGSRNKSGNYGRYCFVLNKFYNNIGTAVVQQRNMATQLMGGRTCVVPVPIFPSVVALMHIIPLCGGVTVLLFR